MNRLLLVVMLGAAGCARPDVDLGRVNAHNLAAQLAADDGRMPRAGGSAVTGAAAIKRYNTGTIIPPVRPSSTQGSQ